MRKFTNLPWVVQFISGIALSGGIKKVIIVFIRKKLSPQGSTYLEICVISVLGFFFRWSLESSEFLT